MYINPKPKLETKKLKYFNIFNKTVILYNVELWSMIETFDKILDIFQRRQLRKSTQHKLAKSNKKMKNYNS